MKIFKLFVVCFCVFIITGCSFSNKDIDKKLENSYDELLFGKYYNKAINVVDNMTIEEMIGQLFLVRYDANMVNSWNKLYPGGYLLFAKDFENHTKDSIKLELDSNQKNSKYPLIFAVDEEGGYVTRVSRFSNFRESKFLSPREIYNSGGYELLEKTEREKAKLLLSLGINLNLAPVADISVDSNDFIYNRSFGKNAEETGVFIEKMVGYANDEGINSCLKHFPGYGNNVDTHDGIAIDNRTYENFVNNDFIPFKKGIEADVPCVLVSHNIVNSIDNEYPASLSKEVIKELRETLNFSGIIITDDLAMGAVSQYVDEGNASVFAINAGNDMIITSDYEKMYNEVLNAYNDGKISEKKIRTAVIRIIAWKYASNLF